MSLTQLEVYSPRISVPPFPIGAGDIETDPIQIRGIEGLGPVVATINTSKVGMIDGEVYRDSAVGVRNIVITVGLNPNYANQSIEALRQILNLQFMPKSSVRLVFTSTHLPQVEISGYVETFEPNIFAKDPEYQISVLCPQPHFVATTDTVISDTTENSNVNMLNVNYQGTVSTGFLLRVWRPGASAYTGGLRLINLTTTEEVFYMATTEISNTATLYLNTVPGNKYARVQYASAVTPAKNLLGGISALSKWPKIRVGSNRIKVSGAGPTAPSITGTFDITYRARYGGL